MNSFAESFYQNFIEKDRYKYILDGVKNTLIMTFLAVLIGILICFIIAVIRSTYDNTRRLKLLNALAQIYLTVIRGTPVVLQLLITYFVIFAIMSK